MRHSVAIILNKEVGGVNQYVNGLCSKLEENEIAYELILLVYENELNRISELRHFHQGRAVTAIQLFSYNSNYSNAKLLCDFISSRAFDSVIANDCFELGMLQFLRIKVCVVFILHGDYSYYYNGAIENGNIIDCCICVSPIISKKLRARKIKTEIILVPPIVSRGLAFSRKELNLRPKRVTFIGRPDEGKGFHIIKELISLSTKLQYPIRWQIILGGIEQELSVGNNTEVYWNIRNEKVIDLLNNSDFFILPSRAEGFPVSVIEALYAGNLCIVSNLEIFQLLFSNNDCGVVINTEDALEYWKHLSYYLENTTEWDKIISNVRLGYWEKYLNKNGIVDFVEFLVETNKKNIDLSERKSRFNNNFLFFNLKRLVYNNPCFQNRIFRFIIAKS